MAPADGWPKAIGGSWLCADRARSEAGRYASRELLYAEDCVPTGGFGFAEARSRVGALLDREGQDVDVYLRVDYTNWPHSLPSSDDQTSCFMRFMERVAGDDVLGKVKGFIIGNETNIEGRNPADVVRIVYGTPGNTNNVYDTVRGAGSAALVFLPGVGPWNEGCDGDLPTCTEGDESECQKPRDRTALSKWERYLYSLAHHAYRNSNAPDDQVAFNLHVYSRLDTALRMNLPKNAEPNFGITDIELSGSGTGAYMNSWVYNDFRYQLQKARPSGLMPWHIIGEWNSLWNYSNRNGPFDDGDTPAGASGRNSEGSGAYPGGLLANFIFNVCKQPELLAVLNFVDENVGGPEWARTAMRVTGDHLLDAGQLARLANWNGDFEHLIRQGW